MDLPPSDFTSGEPYRAHWIYQELPVRNVCATQGAGLLRKLQASLGVSPGNVWPPMWNADLQQALINRAVELSATQPGWDGVISRLRSDLASQAPGTVVGPISHRFGIYVAYYLPNNRRFDAISLPANVTLMRWDTPPADDGGLNGDAVVCVDPTRDTPFLNVTAATVSESATGIRVGPDRPTPPDQVTRPNAAVIGGGTFAAIVVVGAGLWWLFTRSSDSRANPTMIVFEGKRIRIELSGTSPGSHASPGTWDVFVDTRYAGSVRIVKGKPRAALYYPTYAGATKAQHDEANEAAQTLQRFVDTAWPADLKSRKSWHDAILRPRANPSMSAAQLEEWRACRARAAACEERILREAKPE